MRSRKLNSRLVVLSRAGSRSFEAIDRRLFWERSLPGPVETDTSWASDRRCNSRA